MREPFHFRHRCEQAVGVRVQHFRDAGVIGVGIGKDEKQGAYILNYTKKAYDSLIGRTRLCQHERNPLLQ